MHSNSSICWVPQPHTQLKCFHKCYLILSFLYKSCSRGVFHGIITFGPGIPGDHSRLSHKGVVAPLLYTVILILILRNLILQVLVIFCLSFIPVCATIANMVQTHVHELPYNTAWLQYHCTYDCHYDDVIMTMLASQITSLTVVYSIVYSGVNQRKHQSSVSLAFVGEIHRGPVNFPHKWPVTRKMFPFDDVIMIYALIRATGTLAPQSACQFCMLHFLYNTHKRHSRVNASYVCLFYLKVLHDCYRHAVCNAIMQRTVL